MLDKIIPDEIIHPTIENMFILLKNEYLHSERVIKARDELKAIVQSHKHVLEENTPENYVEMHDIEEDRTLNMKCKSKFYKWVQRIVNAVDVQFVNHALNASIEETDAERNPYFSKELTKPLIKILSRIHLFSFVMNSTFGSKNFKALVAEANEANKPKKTRKSRKQVNTEQIN